MAEVDGVFGTKVSGMTDRSPSRDSLSRLRKGGQVGGGVRVIEADGQAPLPAFAGPEWNLFKLELSRFLAMDQPNPFIHIGPITDEMRRREWERHRKFHKSRVINPESKLSEAGKDRMNRQLGAEIEFFRKLMLAQCTPLIALQSAIEDAQSAVRDLLNTTDGSVVISPEIVTKLEQSLIDALMIKAIEGMAKKWELSDKVLQELLNKHVYTKEETNGPAVLFPRLKPKPQ